MGVLTLQFTGGDSVGTLGLAGSEEISIAGIGDGSAREVTVTARAADGREKTFSCGVRIDTPKEVDYFRHGGILPFVLRNLARR